MSIRRFTFPTEQEAKAFLQAVQWVNDSSIEYLYNTGEENGGTTLVFDDGDSEVDDVEELPHPTQYVIHRLSNEELTYAVLKVYPLSSLVTETFNHPAHFLQALRQVVEKWVQTEEGRWVYQCAHGELNLGHLDGSIGEEWERLTIERGFTMTLEVHSTYQVPAHVWHFDTPLTESEDETLPH